jgi:nitrate/TMAO reductase-like tetraheme cytochrome c subunit
MSDKAVSARFIRRISLRALWLRLRAELAMNLRVHRRAWIILASLVGLVLVTSGSTVAVSRQPGFCVNCHEIRPAYDQWRTSAHYAWIVTPNRA